MTNDAAVEALITAGRILEHVGQGDMIRGHVSVRVPGNDAHFLMKPHLVGFDEITQGNALTIDLDGKVVAGHARRHGEVFIHSEIYRARPDVRAVVHTHPTHLVALSATGKPMRPHCQGGAVFAGALPTYDDTINLIRTRELGAAVARALGPHRAVLLKSHGVAVAGTTLEEAVVLSVMLEEAARVQLLVEAAGGAAPEFPPEDIAPLRQFLLSPEQCAINFAYLARKVMGTPMPAALANPGAERAG
ncbi:class II aldolase/adducin family protein [Roseomonas sp. BN140053]|uniref:class II aldolase/adducin family protein n=1 Tax=Roseomonas sp. BN140053 TaxID=3391898 RepID=UPI0039EB30B0